MKQSWAFLLGDSLYSSKLRKSDGLDPVWYVKYGAAADRHQPSLSQRIFGRQWYWQPCGGVGMTGVNNSIGKFFLHMLMVGGKSTLRTCWFKLFFFLWLKIFSATEIWLFSGLEIQQRETWFSESALCLNNKLSLTSAGFSFWKSFRIQWWALKQTRDSKSF